MPAIRVAGPWQLFWALPLAIRVAAALLGAAMPEISVVLALLLVGLSLISSIAFIREITTAIQVSQGISDIGTPRCGWSKDAAPTDRGRSAHRR